MTGPVIQGGLIIAAGAVGFWAGPSVASADQLQGFLGLRTTAGIVFGVMGIWIAVLYQPGLKVLWSGGTDRATSDDFERVRPLLMPMKYCVLILLLTVPAEFTFGILGATPQLVEHASLMRGISMAILGMLVALQMLAVLFSVAPAWELKFQHDRYRFKQASRERRLPNQRP